MRKNGCEHNLECRCSAGHSKCRATVSAGECSPPARVRINFGITLVGVDPGEYQRFLKKHGGRIPTRGFA